MFSGSACADYLKHYWDGREAYRNKKYRESVVFMDRAIKLEPREGARVRWTGTHFESYLPYFHLGRALFELGQYDLALRVWAESERQGKIRDRTNRRLYDELQRDLDLLQNRRLPEEVERLHRDVRDTIRQLAELETRGIGGLATGGDSLEQLRTLVDTAQADVSTAGERRSFEPLGKAGRTLGEARRRMLRLLDAEEQQRRQLQREAEAQRIETARRSAARARVLLSTGECRPEARTLLLQGLEGLSPGALPADLRRGPDALPALLSRAHEQCGDLLGAEQFLLLFDADSQDGSEASRRLIDARLQATLEQVDGALSAGTCDVGTVALLEDLAERTEVGPRLLAARGACGLDGTPGETDAGRAARRELERVRRERREERALSAYLVARVGVEGRGCDPGAIAAMQEALPSLPAAPGPVQVRPDLDLARAYRGCGDRARTRHHLERARAAGEGTPDELDQLTGWLDRTRLLDIYGESQALLVGIADYRDPGWGPLPEVLEDLAEVEAELSEHGFAVQKLIDPTHDELLRALTAFFGKKRRPDSRLVFYYGGHGHTEINEYLRLGYIVPADTPFPGADPDAAHLDYLVSMDGFEGFARVTAANHAMFLFDSCFSGTIFDAAGARFRMNRPAGPDSLQALSRPVRLFVTAGDETEMVPAESVFRAAVVRALAGFADADADGLVLGAEVGSFVAAHGASARNTPKWGVLQSQGADGGDMAFGIPDIRARADAAGSTDSRAAAEQALWRLASQSPRPEDLRQYLERYPAGQFADAAEWMIRRRTR